MVNVDVDERFGRVRFGSEVTPDRRGPSKMKESSVDTTHHKALQSFL